VGAGAQEGRVIVTNPNYIQKQWESFIAAVLPDGGPDVQIREMRRAFFAGAVSLFHTINNILDPTHPDEVTEWDMQVMNWIADEIDGYKADLEAGRA
jgi:hypothetical protein